MRITDPNNILSRFPGLQELYNRHLEDNDEFLSHIFMADITRHTVAACTGDASELVEDHALLSASDIHPLMEYFDRAYSEGDDEDRDVISLSFLFNLPDSGDAGYELVGQLPSELAREFAAIRPSG